MNNASKALQGQVMQYGELVSPSVVTQLEERRGTFYNISIPTLLIVITSLAVLTCSNSFIRPVVCLITE